jgi:N-acetylglucosaminyldiphosphoundecaprenol N-acetyl-beta-D-mannosaminyltransferase
MERLLNGEALGVTRHFLIGSTEHVQARLLAAIQSRFPSAQVVGRWVPPFGSDAPELPSRVRDSIRSARPHVVWVGLGCPRQEKWMLRNWRELAPSVLVGVGAAFDFLAGCHGVAPLWMQQVGLEWLFRLLSEPRRLAWRYLSTNPVFVWRFLPEALRDRARARLGSPAR